MSGDYSSIVISDTEKRLVEGWANVAVLDRQNDLVSSDTMSRAMLGFMEKGGILLLGHENRPCGRILQWSVDKVPGSSAEGIHIIASIYQDSALGDAAWQLIKEKQVTGFSIGGQASETKEIRDKSAVGGMARELTKIELNEISLVQVPANQLATVEGFSVAKSAGPASKQQHFYAETRDKAESLSQRLQAEGKVVQSIIQTGDEWDVAYTATVNPSNEQGGREEQHPTPTSSSERTQKPGAAFSEHDKPATAGEAQKRLKMALKQAGLIWKDDDDSGASALMSVLPMLLDAEGKPEDEEKAEDQSAPIALDAESGTYDAGKYGGYMGKEGGTPSTPVGKEEEAPNDSDAETHSYSTEYPSCPKCGARAKRDSNGNWCTRCDWESGKLIGKGKADPVSYPRTCIACNGKVIQDAKEDDAHMKGHLESQRLKPRSVTTINAEIKRDDPVATTPHPVGQAWAPHKPEEKDATGGVGDTSGEMGGRTIKEGGTPSTPVGKDSKPDYAAEVYTDEARRRGMTGMEGNAYVRARKAGKSPGEAQSAAWKETRDREFMQPKSITKVWKAIPNGDGTFRVDSNHSKGGRVPFKFADEATAKQYIEYHRMNEKPHKAELGKDAMSSGTPGAENAVYSDVKKPVRSRAQWGYLAAKHPEILHRWTHENGQTGPGAKSKLPEHVGKGEPVGEVTGIKEYRGHKYGTDGAGHIAWFNPRAGKWDASPPDNERSVRHFIDTLVDEDPSGRGGKSMTSKSFDEPRPGDAEEGERGHENESEPVHGEAAFTERTDENVASKYEGDGRIYQERVATDKQVIGTPDGKAVVPSGLGNTMEEKAGVQEREAGDGTCAACGVDGKVAERNGKEYCSDCYMLGGEEGYPMEDGLVKETYEEYMSHNSEEDSARDTAGRKQRGQEHFGGANKEVGAEGKCHTCGADVHPGQEQRVCIHGGKKEQRGSNTDANIGDIGIGVERGSKGTPPLSKLEKLVRALAKDAQCPRCGHGDYHTSDAGCMRGADGKGKGGCGCTARTELSPAEMMGKKSVRGGKKGDTPLESPVKKGGKMRKLLIGLAKFESNRCAECGESKETHMENPSWHKFVRLWDEQTTPPF